MYLNVVYSVHHNEERSYSPEVFVVDSFPPSGEQLCRIVSSILENSVCHADWVYEAEEGQFNEWVNMHQQQLTAWLFGRDDVEHTFGPSKDGNELFVFNDADRGGARNIGLNIPGGHKSYGLWVQCSVIDDKINNEIANLRSMPREKLEIMVAANKFGKLIE